MRTLPLLLLASVLAACDGGEGIFGTAGQSIGAVGFRIVSPTEDGFANEARPRIVWTAAEDALRYELFVYADPDLVDLLDFQRTTELSARVGPALADGRTVFVKVRAVLPLGRVRTTGVVRFQVRLLPAGVPSLAVARHEPGRTAEGFRLFNLIDRGAANEERPPLIVLVNTAGEVAWVHRHPGPGTMGDARVLPGGTITYDVRTEIDGEVTTGAFEIDWEGNVLWESRPGVLPHHEVAPGPDGGRMYLKWVFEEHAGTVYEGDAVELVDPATNEVLWEWNIFDHFRPEDFHPFEAGFLGLSRVGVDWSHSNAAVWDPARSLIWVSIRHFDRIIGIDYPSGDIRVTIGDGGLGGDGYMSRQHAPEVQPDGSILFFDNGNGKTPEVSRVAQFTFDETTGAFQEVFSWQDTPGFFDFAVGDADRLDNGNTLIVSGTHGRVIEIDAAGDIVWELQAAAGHWIYRAEHVPAAWIPGYIREP